MEFLGFLAYLLTKFAAYSGWCYVGCAGSIRAAREKTRAACSMVFCVC